jgi:hypothetical protein
MEQLPDENVEAVHHTGELQFQLASCGIILYLPTRGGMEYMEV